MPIIFVCGFCCYCINKISELRDQPTRTLSYPIAMSSRVPIDNYGMRARSNFTMRRYASNYEINRNLRNQNTSVSRPRPSAPFTEQENPESSAPDDEDLFSDIESVIPKSSFMRSISLSAIGEPICCICMENNVSSDETDLLAMKFSEIQCWFHVDIINFAMNAPKKLKFARFVGEKSKKKSIFSMKDD